QPGSRANTLGQAVLADLEAALSSLAGRSDLLGLVLRSGKRDMFIAGADLKELGGARPDPELTRRLVKRGLDLMAAFEALPFPTERLLDDALALARWAHADGGWRAARRRKHQPVGLTEAQLGFTVAVARGQVLAKTGGHYPAPLAALDAIARGCNLPLEEGLK